MSPIVPAMTDDGRPGLTVEAGDIFTGNLFWLKVKARTMRVRYTNWKGETRDREIVPYGIRFTATKWHPVAGWVLRAYDVEKCEERDFALADCDFTRGEREPDSKGEE